MIIIKILLIILCGYLWRLGGTHNRAWTRDVIIPIILGAYIGFEYHWAVGLLTIGSFNIIRMGYGAYDPEHDDKPSFLGQLTHDRDGWWIRGMVGALYGISGLIPLSIYWLSYGIFTQRFFIHWFAYILINALIGFIFCRLKAKDVVIEPAIGVGVGTLFFIF